MLLRLFIAGLWSPAGKGLISWLLLEMWYTEAGVVFDCIVSGSLHSFLFDIIVKIENLNVLGYKEEENNYQTCHSRHEEQLK